MIPLLVQAARVVGMAAAKKLMKSGGVKALQKLLTRTAGQKKVQKKVQKAAQSTSEYAKGKAKGAAVGATVATAATAGKKATETPKAKATNPSSADSRTNPKDYPTYKSPTKSAKSFREAFAKASKEGKKTFTWEGRKYTTEKKK